MSDCSDGQRLLLCQNSSVFARGELVILEMPPSEGAKRRSVV